MFATEIQLTRDSSNLEGVIVNLCVNLSSLWGPVVNSSLDVAVKLLFFFNVTSIYNE